nr:hypothetical protein [Tanacetum cinerariifolium]
RTYTMSDWGCFGLEHLGGQAGNFILPYIVELQCHELREVNRYEVLGYIDTIMSDSEDSTVTYTSALPPPNYVPGPEEPEQAPPSLVYIPYVPEPELPEYIPVEDEVFPAEEKPRPAAASPTTDSPGYILESDPDEDSEDDDDEDPEEDPADYPTDHDDDDKEEEEPSRDDADEEEKEQDEDDDDDEEEHSASADSIPPPPALRVTARISFRPQLPTLSLTKEDAERFLAMPIPPPSPLTRLSSPLPQIPSPPLPASPASSPYHYLLHHHPYSCYLLTVELIDPRLPCHLEREDIEYGIRDAWIDPRDVTEEEALTTLKGVNTRGRKTEIFQRVKTLVDDSQYHYETGRLVDQEARCSREAWAHSIGLSSAVHFELQGYMTHTWRHLVTALGDIQALQAREQARAGALDGASSST